eukprot:CAMPEP_0206140770 /NCGR_PEP_ID=MMETSP1473-20131121/10601_1 /ASSEMBLY_ACC=CAM_ASM_001109 /TAXON_ID=1461547 /ORGANISM="Stichococcus sp, Strain RCC1054" /LENGTH=150 /DNA_ID=CAMNT_0053535053 /DNA_START=119 /DNA_END=571 /DNA_ORIENTATION=+
MMHTPAHYDSMPADQIGGGANNLPLRRAVHSAMHECSGAHCGLSTTRGAGVASPAAAEGLVSSTPFCSSGPSELFSQSDTTVDSEINLEPSASNVFTPNSNTAEPRTMTTTSAVSSNAVLGVGHSINPISDSTPSSRLGFLSESCCCLKN